MSHLPHQHFLVFSWHRLVSSLPCHILHMTPKRLVWKITQVWNITGFTSRLFNDLAEYNHDLFFTVSMWSVWGISPRSTQRACVCSLLRRSPHCPVYRNSVMLLVTEHTPNSQRQPTLPASKPSQQLTSRKTALSTQNNTKVALSKPREVEVNISTIDSYHGTFIKTNTLKLMYYGIYADIVPRIPWYVIVLLVFVVLY